jgi:hypothetical protein
LIITSPTPFSALTAIVFPRRSAASRPSLGVAEHVRVPAHELRVDRARRLL